MLDSFKTKSTFTFQGKTYHYHDINQLRDRFPIHELPFSLKILLENLLRLEDGKSVTKESIEALANCTRSDQSQTEIAFTPSRVLLQDFTGVPAVVDLAAMRDAMQALGGSPQKISPLQPAELVIDHSVQVDQYGQKDSKDVNALLEMKRNEERYRFLRWGQEAFKNFKVVPPDTGICHQVNLEYLARVVFTTDINDEHWAYPDTVFGTDSHTTMINGLGVLGWGVGGIEAEAALLGQASSMLIPAVIGFELTGQLHEKATATDLVLTITQILRQKGVVGKFVEFFGPGLEFLPLADRATIANMAPEYGATCGYFPIDKETLRYLDLSGRTAEHIALVEAYAKTFGIFHDHATPAARYADTLVLDLTKVEPSIAGPKRPQDKIALTHAKKAFEDALMMNTENRPKPSHVHDVKDGAVVIAAITSCTNTSNPAVMLAAGVLAKKAVEKGLTVPHWVKTSLAPGSRVVTEYLQKANLMEYLDKLHFNLVGYGCTTCIGNSGPLLEDVSDAIKENDLHVCAVLSGNRNFEGRIHPEVRMNYLASPPLVVAYALAGTMNIDFDQDPIGVDNNKQPVYLKDIWPTQAEVKELVEHCLKANMFKHTYESVFTGDEHWQQLQIPTGNRYAWVKDSTYVKHPPYFEGMTLTPPGMHDIKGARVLAKLGDSVTTDHISPAGSIKVDSPAGKYLLANGVEKGDFNSYGSRRGNHEVMVRGTFANVRLKNQLAPGTEGGVTRYQPGNEDMTIFDAAMRYQQEKVPTIVLAGKEYGSGSSRDWAAKGPRLLGIKAVIAESYERIHRSNLIGMGILPLQFNDGENAQSLGLTGEESYDLTGLKPDQKHATVTATNSQGKSIVFKALVRLDTPQEAEYYQHDGILHYVLRQLVKAK